MTIIIAADHAGYEFKKKILNSLTEINMEFLDLGTYDTQSVDYPDYAKRVCDHLLKYPSDYGILICCSGIGMSIAANRFKHIRAALCNNGEKSAYHARAHNNANILCLGAQFIDSETAIRTVQTFINTPFEQGRHAQRLNKIDMFE